MNSVQDIENIVVGMDDGSLANSAITTALHLRTVLAARVHVLHALNLHDIRTWFKTDSEQAQMFADLKKDARSRRLEQLHGLVAQFNDPSLGVESLLEVHIGRPVQVLTEAARERGHAMIVLGQHADREVFDFGGTTREILSAATCPVWIQPTDWQPIRRILAPVDLSAGSEAVLAVAKRLANLLAAELTVLHVFEPPQIDFRGFDPATAIAEDRARTETEFQELVAASVPAGTALGTEFLEGRSADLILGMQGTADLIVMGSHGHSKFSQVMLGSQAHRVAKRAGCPVLVVPQRAIEIGASAPDQPETGSTSSSTSTGK